MSAMLEFTIADLEGRRTEVRFGKRAAKSYMRIHASVLKLPDQKEPLNLTRNLPFNVSLLCLSTALCVALRSAVLARLEVLRFSAALAGAVAFVVVVIVLLLLIILFALSFKFWWFSLPSVPELALDMPVCGGGG